MIRDHVVFFFFNNWSNVDVVIRRQNYVTFRFSSVSTHTLGLLLSCRASERLWQLCLPCLFGSSLQCTLEGVQLRYVFSSLSVFLFILNFNLDYWGFIGTSAAVRWQRVVTTKSSCFHLRSSIGWYSCSDLRTIDPSLLPASLLPASSYRSFVFLLLCPQFPCICRTGCRSMVSLVAWHIDLLASTWCVNWHLPTDACLSDIDKVKFYLFLLFSFSVLVSRSVKST